MPRGSITASEAQYEGTGQEISLATRVARNIGAAVVGANITYLQVGEHLGVVPTALTRRVRVDNEWRLSELESLAQLFGVKPCLWMAESPAGVAKVMATKRAAVRGFYEETVNPSWALVRTWLTIVYSASFADVVLGAEDVGPALTEVSA